MARDYKELLESIMSRRTGVYRTRRDRRRESGAARGVLCSVWGTGRGDGPRGQEEEQEELI